MARTAERSVPRTWINEYDQPFLTRPLAAQRHLRRGPAAQSLRSLYASKKTLAPVNAARAALGGKTDSDQRALDAASARDQGRSKAMIGGYGCSHNRFCRPSLFHAASIQGKRSWLFSPLLTIRVRRHPRPLRGRGGVQRTLAIGPGIGPCP